MVTIISRNYMTNNDIYSHILSMLECDGLTTSEAIDWMDAIVWVSPMAAVFMV